MLKNTSEILVAVGSNLGTATVDVTETVRLAINRLADERCVIRKVSQFYETPCFPAGAGPDFVNACVALDADWSAPEALEILHAIEAEFGRERKARWGARTLDLDLIAVGDAVLPNLETFERWLEMPLEEQSKSAPDRLILPHPRLQDRAFVLVPLADVAADWRHPVLNLSVSEMLARVSQSDIADVKPLVNQGNQA